MKQKSHQKKTENINKTIFFKDKTKMTRLKLNQKCKRNNEN